MILREAAAARAPPRPRDSNLGDPWTWYMDLQELIRLHCTHSLPLIPSTEDPAKLAHTQAVHHPTKDPTKWLLPNKAKIGPHAFDWMELLWRFFPDADFSGIDTTIRAMLAEREDDGGTEAGGGGGM